MSLTKKYLKSKPVCKVTFKIDKELLSEAKNVELVGEFNNWDGKKTKMRKLKDGNFTRTLDLEVGRNYQFRYLVNGQNWINDPEADAYVSTGISYEENCVVEV
jgi:1,4-alpha-glucan branching enzyme